ncbi:MAG: DNA polymerase III subunit delta' [Chloroflexi bacterium]|nr:DNA polymerase III subunit delta' [Chloroflexota bacterium]
MTVNNWGLVGHEWAVTSLARDIVTGRLRHAYLIAGPAGVGKRALATAFVQALLCRQANAPCGECRACKLVAHGTHPDVIGVAPVVSGKIIKTEKITIDRIRELIKTLSLKPVEATRRIALVTNFETANEEAANAFLKTLEEPPGEAILILTTDQTEALLPTIISRCEPIHLRPLPTIVIQSALIERWSVSSEKAELLAHLAGGRLGWAVKAANDDEALERREGRLNELRTLLSASRAARFAYADGLARDREALRETLELWLGWWRDVLLVASEATTQPINIDQMESLRRAAQKTGLDSAAKAVEAIQRTLAMMTRNANARLALEVLLLDLPKVSSTD